jgi:hypothetical protein
MDIFEQQQQRQLESIMKEIQDIKWESEIKERDNHDFSIQGHYGGARIKVFVKGNGTFQTEIRARTKEEKNWLSSHFEKLGHVDKLRNDDCFLPNMWKRSKKTKDRSEIVNRANLLKEILKVDQFEDLSENAKMLFDKDATTMPKTGKTQDEQLTHNSTIKPMKPKTICIVLAGVLIVILLALLFCAK